MPSTVMDAGCPCIATCMYKIGIDPLTTQVVSIARHLRDRQMQRALLQFFKPENDFHVREAWIQRGRQDRIGMAATV